MIPVNDISISLSTEDNKSKAILDFTPLNEIHEGDTIFLSIKENDIDLKCEVDTSLSNWLDWIVSSYNLKYSSITTLSRDSSSLIVLGNNLDDLNIQLDLGGD